MADNTPERTDNSRQLHAPSIVGDKESAEGSFPVNNLSAAPSGPTFANLSRDSGRQSLPNPDLHGDGVWEFTSDGDKTMMYDTGDGHLKDDDYQQLPDPTLPGDTVPLLGNTVGGEVDWNAVAPDTYPEHFPSKYDTHGVLDGKGLHLYD